MNNTDPSNSMLITPDDVSGDYEWRIDAERVIKLNRPWLIGILNVTPDSFSDGGMYIDPVTAIKRALEMVEEGAEILDIGGESTRPGAKRISHEDQISRTIPIIKEIRKQSAVAISIDTTHASVAKAALDNGANIINDVAAGTEDSEIFKLAASTKCGLILMHRLHSPEKDKFSDQYESPPEYEDVVTTVCSFLKKIIDTALNAGVSLDQIVIDPGLGFGKSVEQNFELIARTEELNCLNRPILSAASRKSFIGKASGVAAPEERVAGSVAASIAHYLHGVRLFRVHDVYAHKEGLEIARAVIKSTLQHA